MTARQIQNEIFGLGRSIKGINNDIKTRHKTRAANKLNGLADKLVALEAACSILEDDIREDIRW